MDEAHFRVHRVAGSCDESDELDFDATLAELWDGREHEGVNLYDLGRLQRRPAGRLAVQWNPGRAAAEAEKHRPCSDPNPVSMPYGTGSDFHDIQERLPRQRLLEIETGGRHLVVNVNYAPVLPRHFLLIPEPDACLAQFLTRSALDDAYRILALSASPDLHVGFNSLGSWASINHLHFQCVYYPGGVMPVATFRRAVVGREGGVLVERTVDYPLPAIALSEGTPDERTSSAMSIVARMQERNIPHTLLVQREVIYVFPKARGRGPLTTTGPGFFESGGEIYIGEREVYDRIGEEDVAIELAAGAVSEVTFEGLLK